MIISKPRSSYKDNLGLTFLYNLFLSIYYTCKTLVILFKQHTCDYYICTFVFT